MKSAHVIASAVLLSFASSWAWAGPADDARSHFNPVAAGDVKALMPGYADDAVFQWVGGPLDGTYRGSEAIAGVWGKFAKANGPLELKVGTLEESTNPKGATVTANLLFRGKNTIKVRHVLTYRGGKLVNEVWQVAPNMSME